MMNHEVLAFDLGGTKLLGGVVNSQGKILDESLTPVRLDQGPQGLIDQIAEVGREFKKKFKKIRAVGISSAGPLDPKRGILLDPTNLTTNGRGWGEVALAQPLKKKLSLPVTIENDAAAAILAEEWKGAGRGIKDVMILTLGTGLGTGIICNGDLVRSGRGLHPEAGHIKLSRDDQSAQCGCGNLGCAEAYLSGSGFSRRFALAQGERKSSIEIERLARAGDASALSAFKEYAQWLALAIQVYVVLYAPARIILAGSFAHAADLFLPHVDAPLKELLKRRRSGVDLLPEIVVSQLENRSGLLGAARVALDHK